MCDEVRVFVCVKNVRWSRLYIHIHVHVLVPYMKGREVKWANPKLGMRNCSNITKMH